VAFGGAGTFWGSFDKLFLSGVTPDSVGATFSKGVVIPEYVFIAFQATFAGITPALIVGAFAERMKFSAVLLFIVLWFTFSYLPMAHMVGTGTVRMRLPMQLHWTKLSRTPVSCGPRARWTSLVAR